jgi:hypothetical protein
MAVDPIKLANDARINNIFNPPMPDAPPKAVNAFSDGTAPETIGSGQQTGETFFGIGKQVSINEEGTIRLRDSSNNIVIQFDPNG